MTRPAPLAKITRPSPSGVLDRDRLFRVLDRRRGAPLVWVSGPPGSGKTTLVSSYLESRHCAHRWYQLDAGDSDVATFYYYMGLAATGGAGGEGPGLPLYTAEYQGDPSMFARRYFQSLYARLDAPFVLVLDNYHEISRQSQFHAVLLDAVAEMPADGCLVVLSRGDPPAALVRLRASRSLEHLGWNELKLTRAEADALVTRWHPDLGEHARERLYERTDGWAAGLVLMLDQIESLGLTGDAPDVSTPELVFDYLAGEVFENFDQRTRDLLLRTAFLPEITPSRASAVAGEPDAGRILTDLHRSYHFVSLIPGAAEPIFQHHPLLLAFLRARVADTLPADELAALRRATSALLESEGAIEDAVEVLRRGGHWAEFARLVLGHAPRMLSQGRAETLEHWLELLPDELADGNPWFTCWRAACRFATTPREARLLYERAYAQFERQPDPDRRGLLLACSGAIDAILHELDDFSLLDRWIATLDGLMADEPVPWPDVEARATLSMFMALVFRQPDHPRMAEWAESAYRLSGSLPDANARLSAQLLIAINLIYTGQFARGRDLLDAMRRAYELPDVPPLELSVLKSVESMYCMLTGDSAGCLAAVYDGIEIARSSGVMTWAHHLLSNGVAGALGAGDLDTAEEFLEQTRECSGKARRLDLCTIHYYAAWHAMLAGDLARAHQEQRSALKLAVETGCPFYEIISRLGLAEVLAESGDEARATTLLRQVRRGARGIDNRLLDFMCLMTYANIALEHGRERSGLAALSHALRLGREHGFRHHLGWRPDVAASLCERALAEGIEPDYVRHLVRERGLVLANPESSPSHWPWPFRVRTFGGFEIDKDDKPLGMLAKLQQKPLELLRVLVGFGADAVQESLVAETMYPRIDGDYAHRSLTTALHRLRKLVGEDRVVLLRHGRLTLNPECCWLDVRAFEHCVTRIDALRRLPDGPDRAARGAEHAEALLGIYRGPFMAGESDRPHYVPLRERLRNKFVRCVGELARCFEEAGRWDAALDLYRRALEADGVAEGFYRRLMLCYRELGRHAEAVDVYEACRRTFRAEMNTEPSPETTAIYRSLVRRL